MEDFRYPLLLSERGKFLENQIQILFLINFLHLLCQASYRPLSLYPNKWSLFTNELEYCLLHLLVMELDFLQCQLFKLIIGFLLLLIFYLLHSIYLC